MSAKISVFASGLILAIGLGVSGMTNADKVIGFLNVAGDWDPSLAFVMVGAIAVHLVFFHLIVRRESPLFASHFGIPNRKDIDKRLVVGSALFGVGWGLGGFCPGPGIVSSVSFGQEALVFLSTMAAGMWAFHRVEARLSRTGTTDDSQDASATVAIAA
jgi:uncharacterized membrane protein YedE/YeeE